MKSSIRVDARCYDRLTIVCYRNNCVFLQMDLMPFVSKAGCECLNESDDCGFDNCLIKDSSYLESDCDEQVTYTKAPESLKQSQHSNFTGHIPNRIQYNMQ